MFPSDELDTYASISERDVDLALVMALRASPKVRRVFADSVSLASGDLVSVQHSVSTRDGREADIELRLGVAGGLRILQIENKLAAQFQPGQQDSYAARVADLNRRDDVEAARAVLVCPNGYAECSDVEAFDGLVSYETIRNLLAKDEGAWGHEVALLLEHAVQQYRRGKVYPDDSHRTQFFDTFSRLAADAGLPRVPPVPRKPGAGFLWWPRDGTLDQPVGMPTKGPYGAWLAAKLTHGWADIELSGIVQLVDVGRLETALRTEPVEYDSKRNSVRLRMRAPVLDLGRTVEDQLESAREFVTSIVQLNEWWSSRGLRIVESEMARHRSSVS